MMNKRKKERRKSKYKAILETLELCSELLPCPVALAEVAATATREEEDVKQLTTMSQLRCGAELGQHLHARVSLGILGN